MSPPQYSTVLSKFWYFICLLSEICIYLFLQEVLLDILYFMPNETELKLTERGGPLTEERQNFLRSVCTSCASHLQDHATSQLRTLLSSSS
jgi:hypothetical protein